MAPAQSKLLPAAVKRTGLAFMKIIPDNGCAKTGTAGVAQSQYERGLAKCHSKFLHAKLGSLRESTPDTGSDSESSTEGNAWDYHYYSLSLDNLSANASALTIRIGSGSSETNEEDRGVDILTSCPDQHSHQVASVHASIGLGSGGVWLLKAESDTKATIMWVKGKKVVLLKGETHVFCYESSRITIGMSEFEVLLNDLDPDSFTRYVDQRNSLLRLYGKSVPDPRIWALPLNMEPRMYGPIVVQEDVGVGALIGVHASTGESLAIKSLNLGEKLEWYSVLGGFGALLSFKVCIVSDCYCCPFT